MKLRQTALSLGFALLVAFAPGAKAQDEGPTMKRFIHQTSKIDKPVSTATGTYIPVSAADVAGLYWKFGVHDVSDVETVTNYILLKNCIIYKDYFTNDFLWQRLVQAQIRDIRNFKNSYKSRFIVTDVTEMGRFDFKEGAFSFGDESRLRNMGYISFFAQDGEVNYNCPGYNVGRSLRKYPLLGTSVKLDNPITLESIPLKREVAERIIELLSTKEEHDRVLYTRIYFNVIGINNSRIKGGFSDSVEFKGMLERVEVYSDIENKNMIFARDY